MRTPVLIAPDPPAKKPRKPRGMPPLTGDYTQEIHNMFTFYTVLYGRCREVKNMRAKHKYADPKPNDERFQLLVKVAAWCRERRIRPMEWIYVLFRETFFRWPPKLTEGAMMSERFVAKCSDRRGFEHYPEFLAPHTVAVKFDASTELAPANEAMKMRLVEADQAYRCIDNMAEMMGYHPASKACAKCPIAGDCAKKVAEMFGVSNLEKRNRLTREGRA